MPCDLIDGRLIALYLNGEDSDGDKEDTEDSTGNGLDSEAESSGCSAISQPTHGYSISWMLLIFLATGLYRRRLL